MALKVVPVEPGHLPAIASRIRDADRDEVFALSGQDPLTAMLQSAAKSDAAWTVMIDDSPEMAFGVGPVSVLASIGAPWALGTEKINTAATGFARRSVWWREQLLLRYDTLRNVVDDRNSASIRWLSWLGFTISEPHRIGFEKRPFRIFELRANNVQSHAGGGNRRNDPLSGREDISGAG